MRSDFRGKTAILLALALSIGACGGQQPATTVTSGNANATTANANTAGNTNAANANSAATANNVVIEAREPNEYQAAVTLQVQAEGDKAPAFPPMKALVARNGANKRMEFSIPTGEKVVYLEIGDRNLLVLPDRKQYAELNKESTGFEIRGLMTPGQAVQRLQNLKGIERVGEEQYNGRTAIKYRHAAVTDTKNPQAGTVTTESFIYVDKETGLPLRAESTSESQTGQVQGVKALRLITEMSDIKTAAPPELFAEPSDFKKIENEQVRQQINLIFQAATAVLGQILRSNAPAQPSGSPGAAMSPLASPAASPAGQ